MDKGRKFSTQMTKTADKIKDIMGKLRRVTRRDLGCNYQTPRTLYRAIAEGVTIYALPVGLTH